MELRLAATRVSGKDSTCAHARLRFAGDADTSPDLRRMLADRAAECLRRAASIKSVLSENHTEAANELRHR